MNESDSVNNKTYDELDEEGMNLLVFEDTEEYRVIRGQILIEKILDSLLEKRLNRYKSLAKKHHIYFDMKIDLCISLNIISEKLGTALHTLNKIRNKMSHENTPNISMNDIKNLNTGFFKEPIVQKALKVTCDKGYKDALTFSTILLYWEICHLVTE